MIMSKKLTDERIAEIEKMPIIYDDDSPKLTHEDLKEFVPYYQGNSTTILKKETIAITVDADILVKIKASGTGYQERINKCLREAILSGNF